MKEQTLKDKTAKGLVWGLANNGATQLLNLAFGIITARILDKGDYGLGSELGLISIIAAALQEGGFISALTNRKNPTHEDFNSVFWFSVSISISMYVVLWFCAPLLVSYFGEPELLWLSRYSFLGFVFASFGITPRALLFRQLKVKEQSIISFVALIVSGLTGVTMALCGMSYWSIVTQPMAYVLVVTTLSWRQSGFRPSRHFSLRPIREMFVFSSKLVITNIFNCINNKVFVLLFGKFYTKLEVGTYDQADKWNRMGSQLITGMVQGVAQPMFVQVGNDRERLQRAFRKMLRFTSFLCFPAMFGLAIVARQLIVISVGEKWLPSAEMMQMLCVAGAFMPITVLYYNFLISRGRSNVYMWNIIAQSTTVIAVMCSIRYFGLHVWLPRLPFLPSMGEAGIVFSGLRLMILSYIAIYMLWLTSWHAALWSDIRLSGWKALLDIAPFALIAALTMVLTAWLTSGIANIYALLAARVLMASALYMGIVWLTGAHIMRECIDYIRHRH